MENVLDLLSFLQAAAGEASQSTMVDEHNLLPLWYGYRLNVEDLTMASIPP